MSWKVCTLFREGGKKHVYALALPIPLLLLGLMDRINVPQWERLDSPPQPFDQEYDLRIRRAADELEDECFGDDLQHLHWVFLNYGLVPLADLDAQIPGGQTQEARAIVKMVLAGGVSLDTRRVQGEGGSAKEGKDPSSDTESGTLAIRQSELLIAKAAHYHQVEIILFSSRKKPHRYGFANPRFSIALVQLKDRFSSTSELVVLVRSKTSPSYRVLRPPPQPAPPPPIPKYQHAVRRTGPRQRSIQHYDHTNDVDAFHQAW